MKRMIKANSTFDISSDIKEAWFAALKDCNIEEEEIHEMSYEEIKQFEKALESELKSRNIDLSFKSIIISQTGDGTMIEGLKVGGNISGITNSLVRGVIKNAWEPLAKGYWEEYIRDAAYDGSNIYEEDKYGYCKPIKYEKALSLIGLGDKTQYSGHGSQSYIDETKVSVFQDAFGNIKVDRSTLRYD